MPDLREALREVVKIRDEWNATTNPILHMAAGRLNWLTSYRDVLDTQPEPAADRDPGLDWLINWAMGQDSDAEAHYWHINDGRADACGCGYQGEGVN